MDNELLADVYEALEDLKLFRPVYLAILAKTGDKRQALDAIKFLRKLKEELDAQPTNNSRTAC